MKCQIYVIICQSMLLKLLHYRIGTKLNEHFRLMMWTVKLVDDGSNSKYDLLIIHKQKYISYTMHDQLRCKSRLLSRHPRFGEGSWGSGAVPQAGSMAEPLKLVKGSGGKRPPEAENFSLHE